MRNISLLGYYPPALAEVREMQAISGANEPEIEAAWAAVRRLTDNQFLDTADEMGISRWEAELGIVPLVTDTIDERRERIRIMWVYETLYTFRWLLEWLLPYRGSADLEDYTLTVRLPSTADWETILDTLRGCISAAVALAPCIMLQEAPMNLYTGAAFRWAEITEMQSDGAEWDTSDFVYLTDEDDQVLYDGTGSVLYEIGEADE